MAADSATPLPPHIPPPPQYPPPLPTSYAPVAAPPSSVAPVAPRPELMMDWSLERNRLTTFLRFLLVLPHVPVLGAFAVVNQLVRPIATVCAVFIARLPRWAAVFAQGYICYSARVAAYLSLLTDVYPPFAWTVPSHPIQMTFHSQHLQRRWHILLRSICALPMRALFYAVLIGGTLVQVPLWVVSVILGRTPASAYAFNATMLRFSFRLTAYTALVTDRYPFGLLGDKAPSDNPVPPVSQDQDLPRRNLFELSPASLVLLASSAAVTVIAAVITAVLVAPFVTAVLVVSQHDVVSQRTASFTLRWEECVTQVSIADCIHDDAQSLRIDYETYDVLLGVAPGYAAERSELQRYAAAVAERLALLAASSTNAQAKGSYADLTQSVTYFEQTYSSFHTQLEKDWGQLDR